MRVCKSSTYLIKQREIANTNNHHYACRANLTLSDKSGTHAARSRPDAQRDATDPNNAIYSNLVGD